MSQARGWWRVRAATALVLASGLAISACTSGHTVVPHTSPSRSISAAPPNPGVGPSATDAPVRLLNLGTGPGNLSGFAVSAHYLVRAQPDDIAAVEVIRLSDHKVILRHRPARGSDWVTTFAGLAGDRLVLLDADIESDSTPDIGFIYNLNTGRQTPLASIRSAPALSLFGAQGVVYANGDWYYSAQTHGHFVNCVGELNLNTLHGRLVECAPGNGSIWYVHTSETTATWTILGGGSLSGCRTARGISAGKPYTIGPAKDCKIFDNATLGDWQLWSDQSRGTLQPYIPLSASDGTTTIPLGNLHPQSLVVCGGYAYWRTGAAVTGSHDSLVRWRPGDIQPQTVLTETSVKGSPADNELLWPAGCDDNTLTITVTRYYSSGPKATVQVFAVPPDPG